MKNWSVCIISLHSLYIQLPSPITEHKTTYTNTNILTFTPGTAKVWIPHREPSGAGWPPLELVALSPRSPSQWSRSPHFLSWKWWAPPCSTWQVLGTGCEWEVDQLADHSGAGGQHEEQRVDWECRKRTHRKESSCAQLFVFFYTGLRVPLGRGKLGWGRGGRGSTCILGEFKVLLCYFPSPNSVPCCQNLFDVTCVTGEPPHLLNVTFWNWWYMSPGWNLN